jgi:hypothetical protein
MLQAAGSEWDAVFFEVVSVSKHGFNCDDIDGHNIA